MITEDLSSIVERVLPYTMTDQVRIAGLAEETERVVRDEVPGDFVECGVWRGGSMMVVALTLLRMGVSDRDLYLFDTYSGMTPPGKDDVDCFGRSALDPKSGAFDPAGCSVGLAAVQRAMRTTSYPQERVRYIVGRVEDTLPEKAPERIALLHLDTDWYESTKHELETLYPRVSSGGCIVVDDYGHWSGARKATDEYLEQHAPGIMIEHCGYTAVIIRKL